MKNTRALQPDDLFNLRLVSDPQIAPDGSRVAFVLQTMDREKNDYVSNIYLVQSDGKVTQFTSGGNDSTPRWSPDGSQLAFLSRRDEKPQIYLIPANGGEATALTNRKEGAGAPVWSPDGKSIAFIAPVPLRPSSEGQEEDKDRFKVTDRAGYKLDGAGYIGERRQHLFVVDVTNRSVRQLTEGDHNNGGPAWSPDGRHLAFSSSRAERWDVMPGSDIYLVPTAGGQARAVITGGSYVQPTFSPDGSRIAFLGHCSAEEGFFVPARLYSVDRSGGDLRDEQSAWDGHLGNEVLSDVVHSANDHNPVLRWRDDGIYFVGTECGDANLYRADGQVHPVTEGQHTVTDYSYATGGALAFACADGTHLAEIYLEQNGQTRRLTRENDAFLDEVRIMTPRRLSFTGADGVESEGWLLPPPGYEHGKHPLIVYIHGGPMLAHGDAFFFEYQMLADHGFGVFYPNVHGSASYGRDYQTAIMNDWGNRDYQDVLAGTERVLQEPWVDPARVAIIGGSYGGYMTSWALGHGNQFRTGVVERALVNIPSFMGTSDIGWIWNRMFGVYPEEDIQHLWDMSPMKYVANVQAPTLVIHYERDDRTPLEQGEQFFNALRRLGVETRFVMIPEESHGLTRGGKPKRRVERMKIILAWFEEHL